MKLYHCPNTRSSRVLWLLEELTARDKVSVETVTITSEPRSTLADPRNPHPEGKVPCLDTGAGVMTESGAIIGYLADLYGAGTLAPHPDEPQRGAYLNWLHYSGGVMEPVLTQTFGGQPASELFTTTFRDAEAMADRLDTVLTQHPYLMGEKFSAADVLIAAPFIWFSAMTPDRPAIKDWVARCAKRPAFVKISEEDQEMMALQTKG